MDSGYYRFHGVSRAVPPREMFGRYLNMAEGGYRLPVLSFPPCFLGELLPQERDGYVQLRIFALSECFWLSNTTALSNIRNVANSWIQISKANSWLQRLLCKRSLLCQAKNLVWLIFRF